MALRWPDDAARAEREAVIGREKVSSDQAPARQTECSLTAIAAWMDRLDLKYLIVYLKFDMVSYTLP